MENNRKKYEDASSGWLGAAFSALIGVVIAVGLVLSIILSIIDGSLRLVIQAYRSIGEFLTKWLADFTGQAESALSNKVEIIWGLLAGVLCTLALLVFTAALLRLIIRFRRSWVLLKEAKVAYLAEKER